MSKQDNGGPAFPVPTSVRDGAGRTWGGVQVRHPIETEGGMTLRDFFAAKALGGLINYSPDPEEHEHIACLCYQLADAMLAARSE